MAVGVWGSWPVAQIALWMPSTQQADNNKKGARTGCEKEVRTAHFPHPGLAPRGQWRVVPVPASWRQGCSTSSLLLSRPRWLIPEQAPTVNPRPKKRHFSIVRLCGLRTGRVRPNAQNSRPWLGCRRRDNQKPLKTVSVACEQFQTGDYRRRLTARGSVNATSRRGTLPNKVRCACPSRFLPRRRRSLAHHSHKPLAQKRSAQCSMASQATSFGGFAFF